MCRMRSYKHKSTGSHQNSEVKRAWARVVLGWVTSWEVFVLHSNIFFVFHPNMVTEFVCFRIAVRAQTVERNAVLRRLRHAHLWSAAAGPRRSSWPAAAVCGARRI